MTVKLAGRLSHQRKGPGRQRGTGIYAGGALRLEGLGAVWRDR